MRRIITQIFCFFCLFFITACNSKTETDGKKVFNINLDQNVTSLDPAFARNQNAIWMINQIFNGLVQVDTALNTVPCIAKTWQISDDGLTYTFNLRDFFLYFDRTIST